MAKTNILSHVRSLDTEEHEIFKVLSAQTGVDTTSDEIDVDHSKDVSIGARSSGAVVGGTVLLEGCPITADTGTWITLATLTVNAANKWFGADAANGLHVCRYVRARISGAIGNGTVDVYIGVKR